MQGQWKLVPVEPTAKMVAAGNDKLANWLITAVTAADAYAAMLESSPEDPHMTVTAEEAKDFQRWKGLDGATAFHLIERHANGWGDIGRMMQAWLDANRT
jgi:hypothetical protein